ncbi:MAG: EAL domain-containing protein [Acidimicrobiales bacterium]
MNARRRKLSEVASGSGAVVGSKGHRAWAGVPAVLVVVGVVGSILAAGSAARDAAAKSRQSFILSSTAIAATLQLAILHEQDLMFSASGFIADDPNASNQQFDQWATSVDALARYPELVGFGHAVIVTAAELQAFAAQAVANPDGPLGPNGTFQVVPPGKRSYYCLVLAGMSKYKNRSMPAGDDLCAPGPDRTAWMAARDSGKSAFIPLRFAEATYLSIQTPVYQGGLVPATVAGRRARFLGWVGMAVMPQVVLNRALQGHPGTTVILRYHAGSSRVTFQSGRPPIGAESATITLDDGWTVTTFGAGGSGGVLASGDVFALLIAGIALSLLGGALMFVTGTGRARALRVVGEQTDELRHQAMHDALTGLPNRALIMDRMEQLLARSRRQGTGGAALYIDLDEFKNVNDSLGHHVGDLLLVAVSNRLQSTLRDADTIGRMGGDEFVVLIDGASRNAVPELVADRLLEVMRQPFVLDGVSMPLMVNTSIGIAVGDRPCPGDLLRDADVALYQAKAAGKNRYEIFNPEMHVDVQQRIELEFDLRSALAADQFHLVYQPIYDLDDLTIVGVEALLRWNHPTRGTIQPDDFIPILEQTGQIREVGRWVVREACAQMAIWHGRGDTLDVSVNLSGRQLDDDALVEHLSDALETSGLEAGSLIVEITETALMGRAEVIARRLQAIKALGVRIAVDDFGTGYSSLAYLKQFPVDCLKIDRRFTGAITTSPESKALVGTLVQLGKDLGLKTLAEGVETTGQMDHLRGEHVNEAQGYLLARPLDPDVLEARLLAPTRPGAESTGGVRSDRLPAAAT